MSENAREASAAQPGQAPAGVGDDRRTQQVLETARTAMATDESVLAYAFTVIGPSLLVCGWGGPFTVTAFRDPKHLVLTDRHLIIVNSARSSTAPDGVFATVPRSAITDPRPKHGILGPLLRINVAGHVLRIEFRRGHAAAFDTMVRELTRTAQGMPTQA